jgi:hypothetical protein
MSFSATGRHTFDAWKTITTFPLEPMLAQFDLPAELE